MESITHYNSSSLVKPSTDRANGSLPRSLEFTPMDLQRLRMNYFQFGLLFNKPTPKQLEEELRGNNVINLLKDSLSRSLEIFSPLAGRLAITEHQDKTRSFYVDCNGDGALFIDAAAPGVTVAQILEAACVPEVVYSLLPMEGVRNFEGVSKPLLAVQVTELVDGLFIGIAMNHTIADGTAFWHFVNIWSEISRSLSSAGGPSHYQESSQHVHVIKPYWYLDGIENPIRIPDFVYQEIIGAQGGPSNSPPRKVRIFHFTKESIAALKAKANAEIGSSASNVSISSLQAILAHFWRSVTRIKQLEAADTEEETHCKVAINVRHRLQPPLPDKHFGHAIIVESAIARAGELLEKGLGWAALQINKMIAGQTNEEIKKNLKAWVERPQAPKLGQPKSNMVGIVVGGSPWFDVYGNDFGWGRPVTVRGGREKLLDCLMFSHPGAGEDGGVDIHACLSPEMLLAMENDSEFMTALST
ncbi:hypothetical protein Tsubulata_042961 [Turnera subulata]|uniref:Uncharacterized protein n=1 Tax=Turnera subulata TaxID=218843 RepID=A0A9Q0F0L8_9ROSI|nr:hypothetical protein Tsubulata_042961 [Turnera subulata]